MLSAVELQERMHKLGRPLALAVLALMGVVSLWTPLAHTDIAARWFTLPNLFWFLPVLILVLVTMYGLIKAIARKAHYTPFLLTLVLIFLGYSGLGQGSQLVQQGIQTLPLLGVLMPVFKQLIEQQREASNLLGYPRAGGAPGSAGTACSVPCAQLP